MNCQNCLICLTPLEPPSQREEEEERALTENGGVSDDGDKPYQSMAYDKGNCSEEALVDNLKVVFLLKNLFEVPNERLEYYLENFGNPASWARLCAKCKKLVEEAQENWLNLLRAIKQFAEIRSKVVGEVVVVRRSTLSNDNCEQRGADNYTIIEDLRSIVNSGDYSKVSITYPFNLEKSDSEEQVYPLVSAKQEVIDDDDDDFYEIEEALDPLSIDNVDIDNCEEEEEIKGSSDDWHPTNEDNEEDNYYENPEEDKDSEEEDESCDSDDYTPSSPRRRLKDSQLKRKGGRPKIESTEKLACNICGKGFPNAHGLSVHIGRSHGKDGSKEVKVERYVCEVEGCGKEYSYKINFTEHMARHRNERKFKCEICGRGFFRKAGLQYHLEAHKRKTIPSKKFTPKRKKNDPSQKILCTVNGCGKEFSWVQSYKLHMKKHRSEPKYSCEQCGRKFFVISNLRYHLEAHKRNTIPATLEEGTPRRAGRPSKVLNTENEDDPPKREPSEQVFEEEIITRDEKPDGTGNLEEEGNATCKLCGKVFNSKKSLTIHMGRRHKGEGKNTETIVCPVEECGKIYQYFQRQHYRVHLATHLKETKFRCLLCGKEFYKRANFLYHKQSHKRKGQLTPKEDAEGKDPPKYQCEYCGVEFPKKNYLTCHVRTHVGPKPRRDHFTGSLPGTPKHVCDLCGKSFKELGYLTKHKRLIHENKWTLFCDICGKGMHAREHLRLHMRVSHKIFEEGVQQYKCPVEGCRMRFYEERRYEEHMKELHPSGGEGGDPMPYTCQHCGRGFWIFGRLNVHLKTHKFVEGKRSRNVIVKE